ncbi:ROK family transcriptional regulator [Rhodovulum strictum]|uniref:ROK family protein n=1 Tax=Rhodovulum strictum TaxID=58314 RepID=A0A844BD72_9RHOB|nr:ROK family transcriptional regulator [Rhodovulum strictum]MRH22424.1 ROK family protein [Rhodovulum strictum]
MPAFTQRPPAQPAPNLAGDGMRGSNQSGMRAWNERLVLTLVRQQGALSKAEIARTTGLSAQTVSVIMRALESDGLLTRGNPVRGKVGQPSVPMSLNPEGAFFLGLKIGRRSCEVVLTDFLGRIRDRRLRHYPWPDIDTITGFAIESVGALLAGLSPVQAGRVAGLGIAMPFQLWGWAPAIGAPQERMNAWRSRDIRAELEARFAFPVFLENDATAACGAELVFGNPQKLRDFVYFYLGFFVGGGLVLNGRLYTGPNGNAGALGSMPVPDREGRTVQLIELASIAVLERMLAARGLASDMLWFHDGHWPVDETVLAEWIEGAAHGMSRAIVACAAVIDVDNVLIDGWIPADVRARLVARTGALTAELDMTGLTPPVLREGTLGSEARTLGAASRPLAERFLVDPAAISKGV